MYHRRCRRLRMQKIQTVDYYCRVEEEEEKKKTYNTYIRT